MAKQAYDRVVTPETGLTRACPSCRHVATASADSCPECGAKMRRAARNSWAIAALVLALIGLFTHGIACVLGVIASIVALFRRGDRILAIMSLVLNLLGVLGGLYVRYEASQAETRSPFTYTLF